jgi:hypothetical protein
MTGDADLVRSLAPHQPKLGCSSAHENATSLDAGRCLNAHHLDAAGIDGHIVVEGYLVKKSVDRAEIGEVGAATRQRIEPSARRRLIRNAERNDGGNDNHPGGVQHILVLER